MSARERLELLRDPQGTRLLSPGVGWFSAARATGTILAAGECAGLLTTLGLARELIVPAGAGGSVLSKPPPRMHFAVGYGQVLYELGALAASDVAQAPIDNRAAQHDGELRVLANQAGRFWHRSAPGEPSLCEVGREIEAGTPIGLIEVMKTFAQVVYRPERHLPARARIVRVIASDGGDVNDGAPLLIVSAL